MWDPSLKGVYGGSGAISVYKNSATCFRPGLTSHAPLLRAASANIGDFDANRVCFEHLGGGDDDPPVARAQVIESLTRLELRGFKHPLDY
jgi:hypothetical protein